MGFYIEVRMKCINEIRDVVEDNIKHGELHTDRQCLLVEMLMEAVEDREEEVNRLRKQVRDIARGVNR